MQSQCDLWLMDERALGQYVRAVAEVRLTGDRKPETPVGEQLAAATRMESGGKKSRKVAVLSLHGMLEARASGVGEVMGWTSSDRVGRVFDRAMADPEISSIVLDVASPGGEAYGIPELAAKVFAARGVKPVIAVANPYAASGAYWVAAAAERLVVTPSGDVGSVGVISSHVDVSKMLEARGVKETIIRSTGSPYKAEFVDSEPLTDAARQHAQERADRLYEVFVADLARFRGKTVADVKANFGQGRMVDAKSAIAVGMADRIGTLDEIVVAMIEGRIRFGSRAQQVCEDVWDGPSDREREREAAVAERRNRLAALQAGLN